jgi:hypothetical protein
MSFGTFVEVWKIFPEEPWAKQKAGSLMPACWCAADLWAVNTYLIGQFTYWFSTVSIYVLYTGLVSHKVNILLILASMKQLSQDMTWLKSLQKM